MRKVLSIFVIVLVLLALCACGRTDVGSSSEVSISFVYGDEVSLSFVYGDEDIHAILTEEEAAEVIKILDSRREIGAITDCLLCEDVCFTVDGRSYAVAMDGCNTLLELDSNKYCVISEEDMAYLRSVFEAYGAHFY